MTAESLNPEQISRLAQMLTEQREEIDRALSAASEGAKPVELTQPIGRLSRMDAIQQQQMAVASKDAMTLRRQQIQAALQAIENGTYGDCRLCEEPIGYERLSARPEAPLCVDCQSDRETKS